VEGVARGCRAHGMALTGGETAQMPGLYREGHFDLAGTIVGIVEEDAAIHGERIAPGDTLVGFRSTGLHTNGYTLARKILFERLRLKLDSRPEALGSSVSDALLAVHRSYWTALAPVLDVLHGLAHITGGGIPGNLIRVLPEGCAARVEAGSWPVPALFQLIQRGGAVSLEEMRDVFNLGIGMIAVVPSVSVDRVRAAAAASGDETWIIGNIVAGARGVRFG
jgi:phosphoribosylformylglycinamidine cyclo-ligase